MNLTIYKYPFDVADEVVLEIPGLVRVLHVAVQEYALGCIWALVDLEIPPKRHVFYIHGTGHPVPESRLRMKSFTFFQGPYVWHLFYDEPQDPRYPFTGSPLLRNIN
jgi:hypothetical protein